MKYKLFLIIFIISLFTYSKAQWNSEYNYFSLIGGLTHCFGSFHDIETKYFTIFTDNGSEQLVSKNKFHLAYKLSFNGGFVYNHDFKNDNWGIVTGFQYQNYAYKSIYYSSISDEKIIETTKINTVSLPVYIKYGKEFFEQQKHFTLGAQLNYNYSVEHTYNSIFNIPNLKIDEIFINKYSPSFFIGFNYMIFNIKAEYIPKSFIKIVNPDVSNLIFISTNITRPINQWRSRREPYLRHLLRRIIK